MSLEASRACDWFALEEIWKSLVLSRGTIEQVNPFLILPLCHRHPFKPGVGQVLDSNVYLVSCLALCLVGNRRKKKNTPTLIDNERFYSWLRPFNLSFAIEFRLKSADPSEEFSYNVSRPEGPKRPSWLERNSNIFESGFVWAIQWRYGSIEGDWFLQVGSPPAIHTEADIKFWPGFGSKCWILFIIFALSVGGLQRWF